MRNSQKGIIYLLRFLYLADHYHSMNMPEWGSLLTELKN
jgi:hypothetical protein